MFSDASVSTTYSNRLWEGIYKQVLLAHTGHVGLCRYSGFCRYPDKGEPGVLWQLGKNGLDQQAVFHEDGIFRNRDMIQIPIEPADYFVPEYL